MVFLNGGIYSGISAVKFGGIPAEYWWYYQRYTSGILVVLPVVYLRNIGGITNHIPVEYWWYCQPYTSGIMVVLPTIYKWNIGGIASG